MNVSCLAISTAGPAGLHVIFVPDGYKSWDSFRSDIDTVAVAGFRVREPWKSHPGIGIYALWPMPDICARERRHHLNPYLICNHATLTKATQGCGFRRYKAVVLSQREFGSYTPITRIQNSAVLLSAARNQETELIRIRATFLHEFGHAFGLRDEFFPLSANSASPALKPEGPNCAPDMDTAKTWWGKLEGQGEGEMKVGFFKGCAGDSSYIKPTRNSLMGSMSMSLDYGPVSEQYLRNVLKYCYSAEKHQKEEDPFFFQLYPEFLDCLKP